MCDRAAFSRVVVLCGWLSHTAPTRLHLVPAGCGYIDHAGQWFPEFKGHSYARIRLFETGRIVANISATISHAFISAFADYEFGNMWLFGIPADRCDGTKKSTNVTGFWSKDLVHWESDMAIPNYETYNVEVSKVSQVPPGMPPHKYVMILEVSVSSDPASRGPGAFFQRLLDTHMVSSLSRRGVTRQTLCFSDAQRRSPFHPLTRVRTLNTWLAVYRLAVSGCTCQVVWLLAKQRPRRQPNLRLVQA